MSAAVLKFKSLGIDKLVKDLELSGLGNSIAAMLGELTSNKRKDVDGKPFIISPYCQRLICLSHIRIR
jgi:hypothetical protein